VEKHNANFMTPERYNRIISVLDRRQPDLTVITDEVHKGRNLSAIVRTCDAVGIDTIHTVLPKAGFQHYRGTALGSHKWVDVALHENVIQPIKQLKYEGFRVIAAHLSEEAIDYRDYDYTQPTALLLGTEKYGVSESAMAEVDEFVTIPMSGMVASFNVSVASAIILMEAQNQRKRAGCYENSRLDPKIYQNRLFRWCQPILANFCEENGLEFPELDEEGEVRDGPGWYEQMRLKLAKQ
jgi:tRNA (guanosine-2'-O-)-methyltransferase